MKIDLGDIKNMVNEYVNLRMINEGINQGKLIYVIFPNKTLSNTTFNNGGNGFKKVSDVVKHYANRPLPRRVGQMLGINDFKKYTCVVFAGENMGQEEYQRYNERYGSNEYRDRMTNEVYGIEKHEALEPFLADIERNCGMPDTNLNSNAPSKKHPKLGDDFYIVEVPLRTHSDISEFDVPEGIEDGMLDSKCLLLSSSLFNGWDKSLEGTSTEMNKKDLDFGRVLGEVLKELVPVFNGDLKSKIGRMYSTKSNIAFRTMINNGKANVNQYLEHTDSVTAGDLKYGKRLEDGSNKIGIYWDLNDSFKVVQFVDDLDKLYYGIIRKYNELGKWKIERGKSAGLKGIYYGVRVPVDNRTRRISGMDNYYGLYGINGGGEGNPYGKLGQNPEKNVDFALFDDVTDLMAWVREAGQDEMENLNANLSNIKNSSIRDYYKLAMRLNGGEKIKGKIDKRDNSLKYMRAKFPPIIDDMEDKSKDTLIRRVTEELRRQVQNYIDGGNDIRRITPQAGSAYKAILKDINKKFAGESGSIIDDLANEYCEKCRGYKFNNTGKHISQIVSRGFIKKVLAAVVYDMLGIKPVEETDEGQLNEITMNDIKYMVNECVRKIMNKK